MALNNSEKAIIAERRLQVARMRTRQMTQREIVDALAKDGHINPVTREPWSLGTINADLRAVEEAWRQEAVRDTAQAKGIALAELSEVKRRGWKDGDMDVVLKAIKQECDIKGLNAPVKQEHTGADGGPIQVEDITERFVSRIASIAAAIRVAGAIGKLESG